jgi:hypothetical protein
VRASFAIKRELVLDDGTIVLDQTALMRPSWVSAVTPSSRPTDLLDDIAALETQDGGAGEVHLPAGRGRQRADQKVAEGRTGVRTATFPLADDIVAFSDQVRGAPELEIWKRCTEVDHEGLDVVSAASRFVKRVLQQHVRRGDIVDDGQIAALTPEFGEPAADDGLVVLFFAHVSPS